MSEVVVTVNVVIVVESAFGNTAQLAEQVQAALLERGAEVALVPADEAPPRIAADLVLVGAPTHNLGLPSPSTRKKATQLGGTAPERGVREWIADVQSIDAPVVTFTTVTGRFTGSAASATVRELKRRGIKAQRGPDFRVEAVVGPIEDGQSQRVLDWVAELVANYSSS
ncbi:flavodoxin family protein [Demequina sp.]|uniref:flavodoxin family protein n=1 Tax=Demequina sp. TaxID=2050685 RepID=UPI003D12C89F